MQPECEKIKELFAELCKQQLQVFPLRRVKLEAPSKPGVYVIRRKDGVVLHVGQTSNIFRRLNDHLHQRSSFTNIYLKGKGEALRKEHVYQYLLLDNPRLRALLGAYAIGMLCPEHIGAGSV